MITFSRAEKEENNQGNKQEQDQRSIAGPMRKWREKNNKNTSRKQAGSILKNIYQNNYTVRPRSYVFNFKIIA